MVWPGLLLEGRLATWWAVGPGLALEAGFLGWAFRPLGARRALGYRAAINAASSLFGLVLIPMVTFFGVMVLPPAQQSSAAIIWGLTGLLATAANVLVEAYVLEFRLGRELTLAHVGGLALVNAVTVGLALATAWRYPPS